MRRPTAIVLIWGAGFLLPISVSATTIHVPADQPTIQAGINAAAQTTVETPVAATGLVWTSPESIKLPSAPSFQCWTCSATCLKPCAPPDRWYDANQNNQYDPDSAGNPGEYYDPVTTGYTDADLGTQIILKLGNGGQAGFGQEWYYAIEYPPLNDGNPIPGGDQYREWIAGCPDSTVVVDPGDSVLMAPGNSVGPTVQGFADLVASDPTAEWDAVSSRVVNSAYAVSPRIVSLPLFNPSLGVQTDTNGRWLVVVAKIMTLFVEDVRSGATLAGRICSPPCTCLCHADPQCDSVTDVLDVVGTVAVAFRGVAAVTDPLCPRERTDVDCSGATDVLDVVAAVDVAFRGADPPTRFCEPCGM